MRLNRRGPKNDMHCRKMNSIESTTSTTDEIQHEQGRRKSRLGSLLFMEDFEVDWPFVYSEVVWHDVCLVKSQDDIKIEGKFKDCNIYL